MRVIRVLQVIQYHRKIDHASRRGFPMTPEGVALYCEDVKRRWRARGMDRRTRHVRKEHAEIIAASDRMRGIAPMTPAQAILANVSLNRQASLQMWLHRDSYRNIYSRKG